MAHKVERTSLVPAPATAVWARAVTPEGINHEFFPWLTMSFPDVDNPNVDALPVGETIGRSWLRLFGLIPIDYDDLKLIEVEPGRRFLEGSRLFSAPLWQHERIVEPVDPDTCRLIDRVEFTPRRGLGLIGPWLVRSVFRHRHRRVVRYFSRIA